MKKILGFILAALTLLAVSCKQELAPETSGSIAKVFTVSAPESTRTALSGKTNVVWSEGDEINVIADGTGNQYTFTLKSGAGSASAKFEGTIDEEDADETVFYAAYPNIKLYKDSPHRPGNTTLEFAKANTDSEQPALAVENGYDSRLAVMTAVLDEQDNFQFRHAVAYVKSIKLTSAGGARIYGRVTVSIETGEPTAANGASSTTNFVNLAPESGTFVKDAFYLIPITIKPGNSLGNVTLLATDANGLTDERTHSFGKLIPEAGTIYNLGKPVFELSSAILRALLRRSTVLELSFSESLTRSSSFLNAPSSSAIIRIFSVVWSCLSSSAQTLFIRSFIFAPSSSLASFCLFPNSISFAEALNVPIFS